MKLLLYTHDWAPLLGGVQTITMALARGLAMADEPVEVTLVTQTPADGMDDRDFPFAVIRRPSTRKLFRLIRAADVVHLASPALLPLFLATLLHKPIALEHHGYQSACPNGLLIYAVDRSICPGHFMAGRYRECVKCNARDLGGRGAIRALVLTFPRRWLARRVRRNIAPSRHAARRVSLPNTQIIYHGVPNGNASGGLIPDASRTEPFFAYVGRLVTEKGVPVLLRASHCLRGEGKKFKVKIIGDGPERAELQKMTAALELANDVEFVGRLSFESMSKLLAGAIAVVIPSVWEDVAPLAASEQLMLGNMVIASDIGGLPELLGGTGMTFTAGVPESLASRMREALENRELVIHMKTEARRRALEQFTEDRMIEEHLQVYRSLVSDRLRG